VSVDDLELARQFLEALAAAARTGDRNTLYPFLASDIHWMTPQRALHGIEEVREELTWISEQHTLDFEFERERVTDLGDGSIVSDVREIYRVKGTGDYAYQRDRRIELTIREGKVARYEMRVVG
jgi:ketosteroid isomerase-like protein